jgi:predicted amidophosphoribosyltransferase
VVIALDRADQLDPRGPRRVELVPVPSRAGAVRDRGHDSVRALAAEAARVLSRGGLPATVTPSLRVTGPLRDQVGLSAVQRRLNVSGALVAAPVASRRDSVTDGGDAVVVVVDDITTSGATMTESVRALRDAGHRVRAAAVVAHRPRFASGSGAGRP